MSEQPPLKAKGLAGKRACETRNPFTILPVNLMTLIGYFYFATLPERTTTQPPLTPPYQGGE
jgi:hypothetical protein